MIAPAGFEAFFEELAAASATGDARQTRQRRADPAARYRLGYFTEPVPALTAKHRLKLIGENSHPAGSQRPTEAPQPTVHRRWTGESEQNRSI